MNLYFESLRNNQVFGEGQWGFATSYFYPSLHRPVEKTTYSKHIGNKTLWEYEQLMVPVHLPTEHHWLLIVTSVISLCLYVYDFAICTIFDTIKKDSSEMNFSGFLMRTKLSSRRIIGTSVHLNVQSKGMIPIVVYLVVFSQNSYCFRVTTTPVLLLTRILELKWQSIYCA